MCLQNEKEMTYYNCRFFHPGSGTLEGSPGSGNTAASVSAESSDRSDSSDTSDKREKLTELVLRRMGAVYFNPMNLAALL